VKNFVSIFSISLFLIVLWRCNPMFERKDDTALRVEVVKTNLEQEKRNIAENLRDWSNHIDRQIKAIDEKIEKSNRETAASLRGLQNRLQKEKTKVDKSLKDIEKSTNKNWNDVRKRSNQILTDAKIEAQKIEERAEDLID
jgi:hypothetical protein